MVHDFDEMLESESSEASERMSSKAVDVRLGLSRLYENNISLTAPESRPLRAAFLSPSLGQRRLLRVRLPRPGKICWRAREMKSELTHSMSEEKEEGGIDRFRASVPTKQDSGDSDGNRILQDQKQKLLQDSGAPDYHFY